MVMPHERTKILPLGAICLALMILTAGCDSQAPATLSPVPMPPFEIYWLESTPDADVERSPKPSKDIAACDPANALVEPDFHQPSAATTSHAGCRPWKYIVIHHSATESGSVATLDRVHRARGFDELGYHFVIGNGRGELDGKVRPTRRWHTQKWGAHCGGTPGNEYNNYGIGICLVGDFTKRPPSTKQLEALHSLVVRLRAKYDILPANVIGHCEAPNARTSCPGGKLQAYLKSAFRQGSIRLAAGNKRS